MLAHLTVVELATVLAGPSVGQWFAEQGASVIKVENPATGGDVTRQWRFAGERADGVSSYFAACNFGKRSLALDLRRDEGQNVLRRLLMRADVVLTSFRPGAAAALGADGDALRAANPRLIVGEISGYGPDDPRAGYDAAIQAESGFMFLNGAGKPLKMPVALMDILAAHQLKEGLLLALLQRERTERGQRVCVSLADAARSALANQATNWLHGGWDPEPLGSGHPNIVPYGIVFADRDRRPLVLAVGSNAQFRALCEVLGRPEWADDPRFLSNADRVAHRDQLEGLLADMIVTFDREALLAQLHQRRVPAAPVLRISESFDRPESQHLILEADGQRGLRQAVARLSSGSNRAGLSPPPDFGAHSRQILLDSANLSPDAADRLIHDGIVSQP